MWKTRIFKLIYKTLDTPPRRGGGTAPPPRILKGRAGGGGGETGGVYKVFADFVKNPILLTQLCKWKSGYGIRGFGDEIERRKLKWWEYLLFKKEVQIKPYCTRTLKIYRV